MEIDKIKQLILQIGVNLKRIRKANSLEQKELARFQREYRELIKDTSDKINLLKAKICFYSVKNLNSVDFVKFRELLDLYLQTAEWAEFKNNIKTFTLSGDEPALFSELLKFQEKLFIIFQLCGAQENDAFLFWLKGIKNEIK